MEKLAAILGLAGSFFLVLPPIKHEVERWRYTKYIKIPARSPETEALDRAVTEYIIKKALTWNLFDSICIGGGGFMVFLSYLVRLIRLTG